MGPNGLPSSVSHLFVGDVVSVGDSERNGTANHTNVFPFSHRYPVSNNSCQVISVQTAGDMAAYRMAETETIGRKNQVSVHRVVVG